MKIKLKRGKKEIRKELFSKNREIQLENKDKGKINEKENQRRKF